MKTEQEIKEMRDKLKQELADDRFSYPSTREMVLHMYGIIMWVLN